jgi:hypothetical protein
MLASLIDSKAGYQIPCFPSVHLPISGPLLVNQIWIVTWCCHNYSTNSVKLWLSSFCHHLPSRNFVIMMDTKLWQHWWSTMTQRKKRSPANLKCRHEVHTKERNESPNTLSINISLYLPISIYSRDHILSSFLLQKPLLQTAHLSPLIDHRPPPCTKFCCQSHKYTDRKEPS